MANGFLARLEKKRTQIDASLEDLQDGIHATRLYLEHGLFEPFHELSQNSLSCIFMFYKVLMFCLCCAEHM